MKYLVLLAALVPAIALAQDSQTTCVDTPPVNSCTTRSSPQPQVNAPDLYGAFQRGVEDAARRQALEQEAALAAAQRRNLELQNQALQRQLTEGAKPAAPDPAVVDIEARVLQSAFVALLQQQWELPEDRRISPDALALQASANAAKLVGHELHAESIVLATKRLEEAFAQSVKH